MSKPLRSIRLTPKSEYTRFTGERGEIFYDPVNNTLRVFNSQTLGGTIVATQSWVNSNSTVNYNNIVGKPALSTVATSGSYTDLINRPETSQWKISADDSTVLTVPADESVSVRGQGMITTQVSNDSTGIQLIISAPTDITADSLVFNLGVPVAEFSNDPAFIDNSVSAVPTEQAVRSYIDRRLGYNADGAAVQPVNKIGPTYITAGVLSGQVVSMHCERSSTGAIGQIMSFGNGTTGGKGLRMPAAGRLILATLAGTGIDGTLTVQAYLNGAADTDYELTQTNDGAGDVGVTEDFSSEPLEFNAGDTLGWYQASLPTASTAFNVNFYVTFD